MDATVFTPDGMEPDAKAVEQLATRAPHGAGRVMSRTKAAGKWKEGRGRAYAAGRLARHQDDPRPRRSGCLRPTRTARSSTGCGRWGCSWPGTTSSTRTRTDAEERIRGRVPRPT